MKYIIGAAAGACLFVASTALASYIQGGTMVASITSSVGKEQKVMKIVDGSTTCYVIAEQFPAISCVK